MLLRLVGQGIVGVLSVGQLDSVSMKRSEAAAYCEIYCFRKGIAETNREGMFQFAHFARLLKKNVKLHKLTSISDGLKTKICCC